MELYTLQFAIFHLPTQGLHLSEDRHIYHFIVISYDLLL